jgi:hypothetical protein
MPLQYISDYSGNHTAVVIPIEQWNTLSNKYSELKSLESEARDSQTVPQKYTMSEFIGTLSSEVAEDLQTYTAKTRDEWERNS